MRHDTSIFDVARDHVRNMSPEAIAVYKQAMLEREERDAAASPTRTTPKATAPTGRRRAKATAATKQVREAVQQQQQRQEVARTSDYVTAAYRTAHKTAVEGGQSAPDCPFCAKRGLMSVSAGVVPHPTREDRMRQRFAACKHTVNVIAQ